MILGYFRGVLLNADNPPIFYEATHMLAPYGMIHGRFQPFHRGHLEYALAALANCSHLIVGITNPDPSATLVEAADPQRHLPVANPFTFFERQWMVRAALVEVGVDITRVSAVPFPIHHPGRWQYYCPPNVTQFVRLFSDWGKEKFRRLEAHGWQVEELDAGTEKQVSGSEVRQKMIAGQEWETLVPTAVAEILREIKAERRLRND